MIVDVLSSTSFKSIKTVDSVEKNVNLYFLFQPKYQNLLE